MPGIIIVKDVTYHEITFTYISLKIHPLLYGNKLLKFLNLVELL